MPYVLAAADASNSDAMAWAVLLGFAAIFFAIISLRGPITRLTDAVVKASKAVKEAQTTVQTVHVPVPSAPVYMPVPVAAAVEAPPQIQTPTVTMIPAKGSEGEVKLHGVDDKTAAMLMAITANKIGAPLNELRFISIKERS